MVNWKKLFEEDYDELEEKSSSKEKKKKKLFEEASVDEYEDDEDYYVALEAELNGSKNAEKSTEKKKSRFRFEEDDLEDYYEEDDYQSALEEELREAAERTKNSRSFFKKKEKEIVEDTYQEELYEDVDDLEEDLDLEEKKDKKSGFAFFGKKKDREEDLFEEELYDDLEEDLDLEEKKDKKSGFSFFGKKKDKEEDLFEEELYDDLEEDIDLEEKKDKKSGFSFFGKKKDKEEDLFEEELYDDFEEDLDLEEKKDKKSGFSFFGKKKEKEEDLFEEVEDTYSEEDFYDEDSFVDADDDLEEDIYADLGKELGLEEDTEKEVSLTNRKETLEEDIYDDFELEDKKERKSAFSFFSKKKDTKEDLYEEREEDIYDDFDDLELEEKKDKKSGFSFASLKERFTGNDKEDSFDEYDYEEDLYEDDKKSASTSKEEIYDDFEDEYELEEKKESKKENCLDKVSALFKSKDKTSESKYEEYDEYFEEDDEPEDYKTYLERQKREAKQEVQDEYDDFNLEEDYLEEDLELEKDEPTKTSGKDFFASVKDKFSKFKSSRKEENDYDYDYDQEVEEYELEEVEFEDIQEEKASKKSGFFGRFTNKDKYEEDEYEYIEERETISDKLDLIEEKDLTTDEEENVSLQESLRSFGIETDQIQSVDVFEERSPREERERRVHPTLASVKVRRILQEKEIDSITYDLSLSDNKDRFAKSIAKDTREERVETPVQETHESKHQEEIDRLNYDFNRIDRKQDKISNSENFLKDKDGDKIETAMNSIKSTQEEISRDTRDYTIEVEESDGAPVRRSKLGYTSLDDVLSGNEDVLVTDIERKKYDTVSDEPHPEEIENFRKGLFKDKTSEDLVSSRERSNLDNLILDTNIVEKSNEKELDEITMLEENLELLKEDKERERTSKVYEDDLSAGFEEEISIEQVARDSEYKFESYDELKQPEEYTYSDYDLDEEEVYELETQNEIEYKSDQVDIEALNREMKQKKIDEYRSQYWGIGNNNTTQEKAETVSTGSAPISSTSTTAAYDYARQESMAKKFQAEKPRGIEYEEKLYANDVDDYFVTEDAPLTFGEYKTQDRGYRPVSKTTIEEKQRKLDAIFDKYSNVKIPRKNTTEYVQQKISSPVRVDKYKPTQVISAIYGTSKPAESNKVAKDVQAASATKAKTSKSNSSNYIKEIAEKEEQNWNLDLKPRVKKNKKSKKK